MKTLRRIFFFFSPLLVCSVLFVSCQKRKAFKNEDGEASVEVRNAQSESDAVIKDVNDVMAAQWMLRGRSAEAGAYGIFGPICGLTLDSSQVNNGIIKLHYNGTNCAGRTREGTITLTMVNYPANKLKTKGGVVKIEFAGYKVTTDTHGHSVQFDGTAYLLNESGGTWYELMFLNLPVLVQNFSTDGLQARIDNVRITYGMRKRLTYTQSGKIITCVEEGAATQGGSSGVDIWGTTRSGDHFYGQISSSITWNTTCGPVFPMQGTEIIRVTEKNYDLESLYSVDSDGNPVSGTCAYGWKMSWTYQGKTKNRVFPFND